MVKKTAVLCTLVFALPACAMDAEKQAAHEKRLETLYEQHSTFIRSNINQILEHNREVTKIERMKTEKYEPRLYEVSFNVYNSVVMRFLPDHSKERKQAEIDAMNAMGETDAGPYVYDADASKGEFSYVVMEKVDTIPASDVLWNDGKTYEEFAWLLRRMSSRDCNIPVDPSQSLYIRTPEFMKCIADKWATLESPGIPGLFEKIQECMDAVRVVEPLDDDERDGLVHSNLHAGNLLFAKNKEGTLKDIMVVDWELVCNSADPIIDVAMVTEMYVPKQFRDSFLGLRYYGSTSAQLSELEKTRVDLMRVVTSLWFGLAYAQVDPAYFAQRYPEIERQAQAKELRVGQALRSIMHNGFKRETTKDYAEFGSLLLYKGVKHIDRGDHQRWIKTLQDSGR